MTDTSPTLERGAGANDVFDFSKVSVRRSIALLALGAITGLGIAGYGLFTAKGTSTNRLPPEDMALVNQKPIYRSDFLIQSQTQYGVPFAQVSKEERRRVLDDMINEELIVQRGIEVDLPGYDPDVRAALVNGVELQMYADVLAQQPTDAQLRAFYDQHRGNYAGIGVMRLRDLALNVLPEETDIERTQRAAAVVAALRHGAHVDGAFLQKYALRDSGALMQSGQPDLGDIFDFAAQANLAPKVYEATKSLQAGQVSDPISGTDGIHIVVMTARKVAQTPGFEEVRARVWTDMKRQAQEKIKNATYQYLRSKADILVTDDY